MILSLACLRSHSQIHPLSFPLSDLDSSCKFYKCEYSQTPECTKAGSVAQGLAVFWGGGRIFSSSGESCSFILALLPF